MDHIVVLIKPVTDTEARLTLNEDKRLQTQGLKWIINPYDEFAIEEALQLKTQWSNVKTVALTAAPSDIAVEPIRLALAMGIDDAYILETRELVTSDSLARAFQALLEKLGIQPKLILSGKWSIDMGFSQLPYALGHRLNFPVVGFAQKALWESHQVTIIQEPQSGLSHKWKVSLPAIITCSKGLNNPRYPSLPGIMKAKKKDIPIYSWDSLGVSPERLSLEQLQGLPERPPARLLQGSIDEQVRELVRLLRTEARVL